MYGKVLVPLDGSELAECALLHVRELARSGSAGEVTLLSVVRVDIPWGGELGTRAAVDGNAIREKAFGVARKYLDKVESQLGADGVDVKTAAVEDKWPAYAITDYAKNHGMELIAMATHGRTGLKKMMLGSVAQKVVHESRVPVLLIRPEACCLDESIE